MADLRPCNICLFNSQARFKSITIKTLKKPFLTFARLRYFLGGHAPVKLPIIHFFLKN